MSNPELSQNDPWAKGQLSPSNVRYVREQIDEKARGLSRAVQELSRGVGEDDVESRTFYRLPFNLISGNVMNAMVATTMDLGEAMDYYGLDGIKSRRGSYQVHENISPDQLVAPTDPDGAKAGYFKDEPVGYIHVAQTETGLQTSVGALDPTTRTDYSLPLDV